MIGMSYHWASPNMNSHEEYDATKTIVSLFACVYVVNQDYLKFFYWISSILLAMSSTEDRNNTGIPVACSKCNETFQSDSEYVVHYNEMHAE